MREMEICKGSKDPLLRRQTRECGGGNHSVTGVRVPGTPPAGDVGRPKERTGGRAKRPVNLWGSGLKQGVGRRETRPGYFVASHAPHAGGRTDDDGRPDHVCVCVCVCVCDAAGDLR